MPLQPTSRSAPSEEEAQALLDLIWFAVTGPKKSRAGLLRAYAERLKTEGITHSRQDFTGVVRFDNPGELPGLKGVTQ